MDQGKTNQKTRIAWQVFTALVSGWSVIKIISHRGGLAATTAGDIPAQSVSALITLSVYVVFLLLGLALLVSSLRRNCPVTAWILRISDGRNYPAALAAAGAVSLALLVFAGIPDGFLPDEILPLQQKAAPLAGFFLSLSLAVLAFLIYLRLDVREFSIKKIIRSPLFYIECAALLLFGVVLLTGIGNQSDSMGWRQPGSPLLVWQVAIALAVGFGYWLLERRYPGLCNRKMDAVWIVLIYLVAVVSWSGLPLQKAYTAPGVRPPNREVYPYADALFYSLSAESVLSGFGLANWSVVPRPLFLTGLTYVFQAAEGDYGRIIQLQTMALAVIPVLLYFIGKKVFNRPLGVTLAVLAIFREVDAVLSSRAIPVSNSKLILSDLPALLVFLLFTLAVIHWLEPTNRKPVAPVLVGGALGALVLIRTQAVLLLPVLLILAVFKEYRQKRWQWLRAGGLLLITFILTLTPWLVRNYVVTGQLVFDDSKTQTDVVVGRYTGFLEEEASQDFNGGLFQVFLLSLKTNPGEVIHTFFNHFFRNVICTLLVIPPDLRGNSLAMLYQPEGWWYSPGLILTAGQVAGMLLVLLLIVTGIYALVKAGGLPACIPLFFFIAYNASNSIARNSGGRYNLPVDWVGYFYFSAGILYLLSVVWQAVFPGSMPAGHAEVRPLRAGKPRIAGIIGAMGLFLLLGASIPLTEIAFSSGRQPSTLDLEEYSAKDPVLAEAISGLLADPRNQIIHGKALYPRFYRGDQGEGGSGWIAYAPQTYNRIGFEIIHAGGYTGVIYPTNSSVDYFPNRAEVVLIGRYLTGQVRQGDEEYILPALILFPDSDPLVYYTGRTD